MLNHIREPIANRQSDLWQTVLFSVMCASRYILADREGRIFMFPSFCSDYIHNLMGKLRIKCVEILVACILHLIGRIEGI